MELKRVVVTGMGAVTPLGNSAKETWENMLAGKSGAAPITLFDASKFKTQFACEVKNLDVKILTLIVAAVVLVTAVLFFRDYKNGKPRRRRA